MNVLEAIRNRHATRSYTEQPVDRAAVETLLDAAVQAPSAINQQPWAFVVIQNRALLKAYSDRAKRHWAETMSGDPSWEWVRTMIENPDYHLFYEAPALVVICARPGGLNPNEDCCLAAQNLMLAACELGLGTCPIGFARPWLNLPEVKREIGIPAEYTVVFPVIVGHPREVAPPTPRRAPEVVNWQT